MKIIAKHIDLRFEIEEDLPEVGFYLYVFDKNDICIADYLQETEKATKDFAFEKYGVPINTWPE